MTYYPHSEIKLGERGRGSAHVLGSSLPSTNYCYICVWSQNDVFQILGLTFRHISQKLDRRITLMCVPKLPTQHNLSISLIVQAVAVCLC